MAFGIRDSSIDLALPLSVANRHGADCVAFCSETIAPLLALRRIPSEKIALVPAIDDYSRKRLQRQGWLIYSLSDVPIEVNGIIVVDSGNFHSLMRKLEPLARRDALILPLHPDWISPEVLRNSDHMYAAWETSAAANYVARCNLKGHYLEFGTFWGASFFPNYFRFRHWLKGSFFAFDSFRGLSEPEPNETHFTGGDFQRGAYCANERSFRALSDLVSMPSDRLQIVPGFFEKSLAGVDPERYQLTPESVSVCYIDCDLKAPTDQVLDFVTPLLENGALVYFDDWRLCRASRAVGERAAALDWLARNRDFELIEFHRDTWQHQWFIFQR